MPEQLWFTEILNHLLAGPVTALMRAIQVEPQYPQAPISNPVAMEILVVIFLLLLFVLVRTRLSVEEPKALQHVFEGVHGFIEGQSEEIIGGHHSDRFTPFLVALAFFILLCNLIGLIPGFESPTSVPVVPLGLRHLRVYLLPSGGIPAPRHRLFEALHGPHVVACRHHDSH
jgi:F-type H+-transporting ATPase subunit a